MSPNKYNSYLELLEEINTGLNKTRSRILELRKKRIDLELEIMEEQSMEQEYISAANSIILDITDYYKIKKEKEFYSFSKN